MRRGLGGAALAVLVGAALFAANGGGGDAASARAASTPCSLDTANAAIQHVIYVQFDNTHLSRDKPNIASDLEQMPALKDFMTNNGTLLSREYTPLISHTANDILTSITGLYGDRHGQPISNTFGYRNNDASNTASFRSSFGYWTTPVNSGSDTHPLMTGPDGHTAPAPWVPFTRGGCDVGSVATANTVLENSTSDVTNFFGAGSPEATGSGDKFGNYVGIAVHCSQAATSKCAANSNAHADQLPDEPGGYSGYNALMGAKYVIPAITGGSSSFTDESGGTVSNFPGFDAMSAGVSLGYVAKMQESGVPVTYAYISDAHDKHTSPTRAYGPGEQGYHDQLVAYNTAFTNFFADLAAHGIDKSNTLFVMTADENDHFVGRDPVQRTSCDGQTTFCTYSNIGEVNLKTNGPTGIFQTQKGNLSAFSQVRDVAPSFYLTGATTPAQVRQFERDAGSIHSTNPVTGTDQQIAHTLADRPELKLLHMVTGDPQRTPDFTVFANPDWYVTDTTSSCPSGSPPGCPSQNPSFAWNHGSDSPDIIRTWLGVVGPGVRAAGQDDTTWADHTDIRPTILRLAGLSDSYQDDGRVLTELLTAPPSRGMSPDRFQQLGALYKKINAPVAQLGMDTLAASTTALDSGSAADDSRYTRIESQLTDLGADRDAVAGQMRAVLDAVEFRGGHVNKPCMRGLSREAQSLLDRAAALKNGTAAPPRDARPVPACNGTIAPTKNGAGRAVRRHRRHGAAARPSGRATRSRVVKR